jgi:hypothetical protein
MRKTFILAVGLVLGVASSQALSPSFAAYFSDQEVYDAIAHAQSITVADSLGEQCAYPCVNPSSTMSTTNVSTPSVTTNSIVIQDGIGREPAASLQVGAQLEFAPLSSTPTQAEINDATLAIRQYMIDRGMAIETGSSRMMAPRKRSDGGIR